MPDPSLLERLRQSSVVQAIVLFLGAAWVVLQVVDLMEDQLGIPEWVFPSTVALLLAGLVIVLATAWVQSLPSTTAAEAAGERPTDWEIAPADVVESLRSGRLPHLTWGRAVLGGVLALSLLFGVAGVYVLISDGPRVLAPAELTADEAAVGIAVLPFDVNGPDLELWREGMVDLLATGLDGVGGYRTIDSRTTLARWKEGIAEGSSPDLRTILGVAGRTGARYAITGSAVGLGPSVRLVAEVYDLADGSKVADGSAEGPADSVLVLVDRLALSTMRDLLSAVGGVAVSEDRLTGVTTTSLEAMRSFLEGEALYRRGDFTGAIAAYETATAIDSTFALAVFRASQAYGWTGRGSEADEEVNVRLANLLPVLPQRDRVLARLYLELDGDSLRSAGPAEAAVKSYPDDPEAWYILGEVRYHEPGASGSGHADAREAFDRALELSPDFVPYYFHALELSLAMGDLTRSEELFVRAEELAPGDPRLEDLLRVRALVFGDREEAKRAIQSDPNLLFPVLRTVNAWPSVQPRVAELVRMLPTEGNPRVTDLKSVWELGVGRQAEAIRLWEELPERQPYRVTLARHIEDLVGSFPGLDVEREYVMENCLGGSHPQDGCAQAVALHAVDAGRRGEVDAAIAWHDAYADSVGGGHALIHRRIARTLEGYAAWKEGDPVAARTALLEAIRQDRFAVTTRWILAGVLEDLGDLIGAVRVLSSLDGSPTWSAYAHLRQGRLYERMSDEGKATQYYTSALAAWVEADPGFAPKAEAQAGLERLGG